MCGEDFVYVKKWLNIYMDNLHNSYLLLASNILLYGKSYPKKHGDWVSLKLNDDHWFILDTWNKSITFVVGGCDYNNMWTGFSNYEKLEYLGIDFGGFECHVDEERLNYYHKLVRDNYEFV